MCLGIPGEECSDEGGSCQVNADCCDYPDVECLSNNTCGKPVPE